MIKGRPRGIDHFVDGVRLSQACGNAGPMVFLNERWLRIEYFCRAGSGSAVSRFLAPEIEARLRGEDMASP
jgi:hypothetical protein